MYYNYLSNFVHQYFSQRPFLSDLTLVIGIIVIIAVGYLLGSLNFGIIFSKLFYKDDVRNHGSHNAGATNMQRTYGTAAGVITIIGDAVKAVIACLVGGFLFGLLGTYIAGLACVFGHIFPLYYGFKGGKGVVTVATLIAMTSIKTFIPLIVIFVILVAGTKFISMGSVICGIVYPLILFNIVSLNPDASRSEYIGVLFSFVVAAIVVLKHKENIKRIFNHTESKISFKKKDKKTSAESADSVTAKSEDAKATDISKRKTNNNRKD